MNAIALLLLLSQAPSSTPATTPTETAVALPVVPPAAPLRQLTVHGFRSPSIGVELREGFFAFHVGLFPLIVDASESGEARTTWFLKTGVTAYFLRYDLGSGRPSSLFASVSLVQGLNNAWDVNRSVTHGTGVHGELGLVWAAWRGLDLRLGVGVLLGFDGRLQVHPTPGVSWSFVL